MKLSINKRHTRIQTIQYKEITMLKVTRKRMKPTSTLTFKNKRLPLHNMLKLKRLRIMKLILSRTNKKIIPQVLQLCLNIQLRRSNRSVIILKILEASNNQLEISKRPKKRAKQELIQFILMSKLSNKETLDLEIY